MDIVWIEGRGSWLCGPDTASWTFELPAATACVGIRFRPGAAARVLRVDAPDVVDRRVRLDALIGSRAARIADEKIQSADGPLARMAQLEHLAARLGGAPDAVVDATVRALAIADRRDRPPGGADRSVVTSAAATLRPSRRVPTVAVRAHRSPAAVPAPVVHRAALDAGAVGGAIGLCRPVAPGARLPQP